jgi:subtilisin-like proprotein convertase family protein
MTRRFGVTSGVLAAGLAAIFLALAVSSASAAQFINATPITINDTSTNGVPTPATPSPSQITVAEQTGVVKSVKVTVSGLNHTSQKDVDILLQSPSGKVVTLLSDLGGRSNTNPTVDLGFRTGAASFPTPGAGCFNNGTLTTSGFFVPTDNDEPSLDCPSPAPTCVTDPALDANNTSLETFDETDPNGTWKLFVSDDCQLDLGSSNGWALDLTTGPPTPTPTSPTPAPTPPAQSVQKKKHCKKRKHKRSAASAKKKKCKKHKRR